jgi:hypothetical protein
MKPSLLRLIFVSHMISTDCSEDTVMKHQHSVGNFRKSLLSGAQVVTESHRGIQVRQNFRMIICIIVFHIAHKSIDQLMNFLQQVY